MINTATDTLSFYAIISIELGPNAMQWRVSKSNSPS